jgi:hypothetical protein
MMGWNAWWCFLCIIFFYVYREQTGSGLAVVQEMLKWYRM